MSEGWRRNDLPAKDFSRIMLRDPAANMHMLCTPLLRTQADNDALSRKVVRDSIRGISEFELGPGKTLLADGDNFHSEGGHSVHMAFSAALQERANNFSQSFGTERRHQMDIGDDI